MNQQPEWRSVVGYEGRYEVSEDGRIRSMARRVPIRLGGTRAVRPREIYQHIAVRPGVAPRAQVTIWKDAHGKSLQVAPIVLAAFKGPKPSALHQACHNDGDSLNNRASNLRWGTPKENIDDRERHGRTARGEANGMAKLTEEKVRAIRASERSGRALAAEMGVSEVLVGLVRSRKIWKGVGDAAGA